MAEFKHIRLLVVGVRSLLVFPYFIADEQFFVFTPAFANLARAKQPEGEKACNERCAPLVGEQLMPGSRRLTLLANDFSQKSHY